MNPALNLSSPRAQKARYARTLRSGSVHMTLLVTGIISVISGSYLLVIDNSLGYVALIPALVCLIVWLWYKGELSVLDEAIVANPDSASIDSLLSARTLALLKTRDPSAYDLWQAVQKTQAQYFYCNRYLLNPVIFEQMLSRDKGSASAVWQHAGNLRQRYNRPIIENSVLMVAMLKTIPEIESLLRSIKLEITDLEEGIEWMADTNEKRRLAREKQYFGGLARDWAYGYTPMLRYLGHNISEEIQRYGFFSDTAVHEQIVNQMTQTLSGGSNTATLIGDIGAGKTTCVYGFAERLLKDSSLSPRIRYHQVISLDAPALLAQAKGRGELESLVIQLLNEAGKAKNMILFFDDSQVFFSNENGVDLSNVLQPALESGSVRLLFAMTPKEWQHLSASNAAVSARLQAIQLQPTDEKQTIQVLRDQIMVLEYERKVVFTYQALREAYRLGSRYIDSQVMPGAALSVLSSAASFATDGLVTEEIVQRSIESSVGVKLAHAEADESQVLLNLEEQLKSQVISQRHAISVIANALRRSRSGVGNPDRPIGTFLFLGPTGVGKTELSKALARTYFGSEESVVRVDMNQYVQPSDVNRLITPMLGDQLGFLGQVRRQPFSVILLDEIEKAHPNVVNLLLQTLDEGVMRDIDNKAVSFKDAIIIATSNAGADEIRRMIEAGEDINEGESAFIDKIIHDGIFAPEFINRFDEVVLFKPLTQDELVQVVDLIVAGINKTLDRQKVSVNLTDAAKRWLVEKGYDSRLGARPMRRMAQRYVENILAKRLLDQSMQPGATLLLDITDFEQLEDS